ncbi:MAG: hypothetical protein MJZ81_09205 [Bacteroidales bacterium]|nr:hypothetical protein [Bacteroidales bacterium]
MPNEDPYKFLKFMRNWYYLFKTRDTPEKKLAFITTILEYAFEKKIPECVKNGIENLSSGVEYAAYDAFCICQPIVDKDREDFENGRKGASAGKRGGRPKTKGGIDLKTGVDVQSETQGGIENKTPRGFEIKPPAVSDSKPPSFLEEEEEKEKEYENEDELKTPKPPEGGLRDCEIKAIEHSSDVRDARARADAGRTPTDEEVYACARKHGHPKELAETVIRQIRESDGRYFSRTGRIVYIGIKNLSIVMSNFKSAAAQRARAEAARNAEPVGQRMSLGECQRSVDAEEEQPLEDFLKEVGVNGR